MSVGMVYWAYSAITHVNYTDRYIAHGHAKYDKAEDNFTPAVDSMQEMVEEEVENDAF